MIDSYAVVLLILVELVLKCGHEQCKLEAKLQDQSSHNTYALIKVLFIPVEQTLIAIFPSRRSGDVCYCPVLVHIVHCRECMLTITMYSPCVLKHGLRSQVLLYIY